MTRAKRSIAQFRLRTGMPIGAMVTLRGQRMYDFLDRTLALALPRIRDFRGVPTRSRSTGAATSASAARAARYPEIDYDKIDRLRGLEISIVTTAKTDEEGRKLLELLGMPFQAQLGGDQWPRNRWIAKAKRGRASRSAAQPLPALRPAARLHAPLRDVPHLLPGACPGGPAARRDEVELVELATTDGRRRGGRHQRQAPPGTCRERTTAEETNETDMNVTDPIADMLTRIRNASAARHKELSLPSSRMKREIARS